MWLCECVFNIFFLFCCSVPIRMFSFHSLWWAMLFIFLWCCFWASLVWLGFFCFVFTISTPIRWIEIGGVHFYFFNVFFFFCCLVLCWESDFLFLTWDNVITSHKVSHDCKCSGRIWSLVKTFYCWFPLEIQLLPHYLASQPAQHSNGTVKILKIYINILKNFIFFWHCCCFFFTIFTFQWFGGSGRKKSS